MEFADEFLNATVDDIMEMIDEMTFEPTGAPTDIPLSINDTWIPIYSTVALSILQSVVLLIIFECGRRNRHVADVYERRRLLWPSRVPPPLMQHRGCFCGFLGFEWFRVKCADPEYLARAAEEQMERLVKKKELDAKREERRRKLRELSFQSHTTATEDLDINKRRTKESADKFLVQAEQQCLEEAPFYFPDTLDSLDAGVDFDIENPDADTMSAEMSFDFSSDDGFSLPENFDVHGEGMQQMGQMSVDFAEYQVGLNDQEYQVDLNDQKDYAEPAQNGNDNPRGSPVSATMLDFSGKLTDMNSVTENSGTDGDGDTQDISSKGEIAIEMSNDISGSTVPRISSLTGLDLMPVVEDVPAENEEADNKIIPEEPLESAMDDKMETSSTAAPEQQESDVKEEVTAQKSEPSPENAQHAGVAIRTPQSVENGEVNLEMQMDEDGSIDYAPLKGDDSVSEDLPGDGPVAMIDTIPQIPVKEPLSEDESLGTDDTFGHDSNYEVDFNDSFAPRAKDNATKQRVREHRANFVRSDTNSTSGSNDGSTRSKPGSILKRMTPRRVKSDTADYRSHTTDSTSSRKVRFFAKGDNASRSMSDDSMDSSTHSRYGKNSSMDSSSHRRWKRMSERSISIRDMATGIAGGVTGIAGGIAGGAKGVATGIAGGAKGVATGIAGGAKGMATGIAGGAKGMATGVTGFVKDPNMKKVKELLKMKEIAKATGNMAEYLKVKEIIRATKVKEAMQAAGKVTKKGRKKLRKSASRVKKTVPTLNTVMADQMSRMRTYQQDIANWDGDIVSTTSKGVTNTSTWFTTLIRKNVLKMQDDEDDEEDEGQQTQTSKDHVKELRKKTKVTKKVHRRPLSPEQAELLRCIGLDSFVLLQFLEFGFAVATWPLVFAVLVLIPTYRTGGNGEVGFFTTTVTNLPDDSPKLWLVVVYGYLQILLILRRLWVEWEMFIPLRNDFLERGDFIHTKYQDQYRKTCIIEYIPKTHCKDKTLFDFFDALFPGQIRRAEVLLNVERMRRLIKERLKYIKGYENEYAKKVHKRALYLRKLHDFEEGKRKSITCCGGKERQKPLEPTIKLKENANKDKKSKASKEDATLIESGTKDASAQDETIEAKIESTTDTTAKSLEPKTTDGKVEALPYYHGEIIRLNSEIEDEFIRLARAKNLKIQKTKESWISKWLGLRYVMGWDNGRVHSSTAFVEFDTLTTKQQAIQCNLTGANALLSIQPVPEVRDIIWDNAHVSRRLIDRRRLYLNAALLGCLLAWSILVATIRSYSDISQFVGKIIPELVEIQFVATVLDNYVPALIVEAIVRYIAFTLRYVAIWIRFKTVSEFDSYVLIWYFTFRLVTFVFVIIGGNLLETGENFFEDPIGFIKDMARDAASQSQFFMSYVLVAGGLQIFLRLSQVHNIFLFWFTKQITKAEAVSLRKLDFLRVSVKKFDIDEFIPLFLFVFMISILYGWIAPLSNLFTAIFFKCSFKVFKYMTLYIYGNEYEGGGFLFYRLTELVFFLLYGLIILLSGYFSLFGSAAMAGVFSLLFFVTIGVHAVMRKNFIRPSETLALTKALEFDNSVTSPRDRALREFFRAKAFLDDHDDDSQYIRETQRLMPRMDSGDDRSMSSRSRYSRMSRRGSSNGTRSTRYADDSTEVGSVDVRDTLEKFARRYEDEDAMSDITGATDDDGPSRDFFIYRQPSLNRATWETLPRGYWETAADEVYKVEIWR